MTRTGVLQTQKQEFYPAPLQMAAGDEVVDLAGDTNIIAPAWDTAADPTLVAASMAMPVLLAPAPIVITPTAFPDVGDQHTFEITGIDYKGDDVYDTIAFASTDAAGKTGTQYFKSLTAITCTPSDPGGTLPGATDVGVAVAEYWQVPSPTERVTMSADGCVIHYGFAAVDTTTTPVTSGAKLADGASVTLDIVADQKIYLAGVTAGSGDCARFMLWK